MKRSDLYIILAVVWMAPVLSGPMGELLNMVAGTCMLIGYLIHSWREDVVELNNIKSDRENIEQIKLLLTQIENRGEK